MPNAAASDIVDRIRDAFTIALEFDDGKRDHALMWVPRAAHAARIVACTWSFSLALGAKVDAQNSRATSALVAGSRPAAKDLQLVLTIAEFHARWQAEWRFAEQWRSTKRGPEAQRVRHKFFHCDVDLFADPSDRLGERKRWGNPEPYAMIRSRYSVFGVCPSWLLTSVFEDAVDESAWRDGALLESLRPSVGRARESLIRQLGEALASDRGNDWLAGQFVRFLVDQREFERAKTAVGECRATQWWCAALAGFVAARSGEILAADSAYSKMRRLMPDSALRTWQDLRRWLPADEAAAYSRDTREQQDTILRRLWWLADPLYRVPGNARHVEQDTREMEIALRSATMQDERYSFDPARGGDAVATVIRRYGWPTYTGWSGPEQEQSHSRYLEQNHSSPIAPPYTTFEYTTDRLRTLSSSQAVALPFAARSSDWNLAPDLTTAGPLTNWWPVEHFRHNRRLVQLPDGQTVAVRRQSSIDVASAVVLSHPALNGPSARYDVMLLATRDPSKIDSIDQRIANAGAAVVLRGRLANAPTLLAIEALGVNSTNVDARTRFGYTPPATLSELRPGEIALSDLALLRKLSEDQIRAPSDSLLDALLPSTTLAPSTRTVTLYWESYGVSPADSASLAVRVASEGAPGLLQRIAIATGLVDDPTREVTIRWKDGEALVSTTTLRGPVPVQMRALSLDLTALRAGRYTVEVLMTLRDGRSASARTTVELQP